MIKLTSNYLLIFFSFSFYFLGLMLFGIILNVIIFFFFFFLFCLITWHIILNLLVGVKHYGFYLTSVKGYRERV